MSSRRELLVLGAAATLLPLRSTLSEAASVTSSDPALDNFAKAYKAFNNRWWDANTTPPNEKSLESCLDNQVVYFKIKGGGRVGPGKTAVMAEIKNATAHKETFTPLPTFPPRRHGENITGKATWHDEDGTPPYDTRIQYHMQCLSASPYLLTSLFATPDPGP